MKRILMCFALALAVFACKPKATIAEDREAMYAELNTLMSEIDDEEDIDEEYVQKALDIFYKYYSNHKNDSLGLEIFHTVILSEQDGDKIEKMYADASPLIKEDEFINKNMQALKKAHDTQPGKDLIDIEGVDALTGEPVKLSELIAGDKPVVLDFWASWCYPCAMEITETLIPFAAENKAQIIGIAIWEESIEDTRAAIERLGITWPVIFAGDRKVSPSDDYGVGSIPTLFRVSPDKKFVASGRDLKQLGDF